MRATGVCSNPDFAAKAIAGTHTILIALDCKEECRHGLLGFAFKREVAGGGEKWLTSLKVFKSVEPNPQAGTIYSTEQYPIQSFLWGDYTASPDTAYKFSIYPMYGTPGALQKEALIEIEVRTEKEFDQGHGVWFNRGAIASQAFERRFHNEPPPAPNDPRAKRPNGCRAGCWKPASPSSTAPKRATACASQPTSSPTSRSWTRSKAPWSIARSTSRSSITTLPPPRGRSRTPTRTPCARRAYRSTTRR